jgi:hypothetical protein
MFAISAPARIMVMSVRRQIISASMIRIFLHRSSGKHDQTLRKAELQVLDDGEIFDAKI